MKVLAFDLNTKCTGILGAVMDGDEVVNVVSASIFVNDFKVSEHFPYKNHKRQIKTSPNGEKIHNAYVKEGEEHVSVTEKKKRDSAVRNMRNRHQIDQMSSRIGMLLSTIRPDLVLIERNEMFRGTMTIEVLAKLTGTLIGECNAFRIPYETYNVNEIRKPYNIPKLCVEYAQNHPESIVAAEPDLAKAAIRYYLTAKYERFGLDMKTLDESDAALVFDFWRHHKRKPSGRM